MMRLLKAANGWSLWWPYARAVQCGIKFAHETILIYFARSAAAASRSNLRRLLRRRLCSANFQRPSSIFRLFLYTGDYKRHLCTSKFELIYTAKDNKFCTKQQIVILWNWVFDVDWWINKQINTTATLCLKKVPTFKLSVTLSNHNRFSEFCTAGKRRPMKFVTKSIWHYPP